MTSTCLHMVVLTVTESIWHLVAFNYTTIIVVCTSPILYRYSRGCACTTFLNYATKHCRHYRMEVNGKHEIQPGCLREKLARIFCLPLASIWKFLQWTRKMFVSSPSAVQPAWYYVQALVNTATSVAALEAHSVNMLSTAISITISKWIQDKTFGPNLLSPVHFHMVMLIMTKTFFSLSSTDRPQS